MPRDDFLRIDPQPALRNEAGTGLAHHCAAVQTMSPRSAKLALRMMALPMPVPPHWRDALEHVLSQRASTSTPLSGSDLMTLTVLEDRLFDRVARLFDSRHQREARGWLDAVLFDAARVGAPLR